MPTDFGASSEVQMILRSGDGSYNRIIKEVYLRHLIEGSIKENEKQNITTGVSIIDLSEDQTLEGHNEDTPQFAASINKLPVSLLALEDLRSGKIKMSQKVKWTADDVRGGLGKYDQASAPHEATFRDLLYDMLNRSGNTAVRVIVNNVLHGPEEVNKRWSAKPQLSHTRLDVLDATHFYLGNTTPHDSLWSIRELMKRQDTYALFMKNAMANNIYTDFGVRSYYQENGDIQLINKIGLLDDPSGNNRHDVGIIYNQKEHKAYAYSLMTTAPYDENNTDPTVQADQSLKDMGQSMLQFAGSKKGQKQPVGSNLRFQVDGRIHY